MSVHQDNLLMNHLFRQALQSATYVAQSKLHGKALAQLQSLSLSDSCSGLPLSDMLSVTHGTLTRLQTTTQVNTELELEILTSIRQRATAIKAGLHYLNWQTPLPFNESCINLPPDI